MRRTLQLYEKALKLSYESALQGLNYRMLINLNGVCQGAISLHLYKSNQMSNIFLKKILNNQKYMLIKEEQKLFFNNKFDELKNLEDEIQYYPDTGLLVLDKQKQQLLIHLSKDNNQQLGIPLGYVLNKQSIYILQTLRIQNGQIDTIINNQYNFFIKRFLNISTIIAFLMLLNGISYSTKHEIGLFVSNKQEYDQILQQ